MPKEWKKRILIDTDLGDDIDDAAALIMALRSPELEVVGITTVFQDTKKRAYMVQELCQMMGREDIPVCAGYGRPLIQVCQEEKEPIQYEILQKEEDTQLVKDMDAPEFIIQQAKKDPNLIIVAIGSLTNIGMACYRAPEVMKYVKIIIMGGNFSCNAPEWNIQCDPEAAKMTLDCCEHIRMFGLDVTKHTYISDEELEKLCPSENELMAYYKKGIEVFRRKTGYVYTLHDALLIAYLIDPFVAEIEKGNFTVELQGAMTRGCMVSLTNAYDLVPEVEKDFYYAVNLDQKRFMEIVRERLY